MEEHTYQEPPRLGMCAPPCFSWNLIDGDTPASQANFHLHVCRLYVQYFLIWIFFFLTLISLIFFYCQVQRSRGHDRALPPLQRHLHPAVPEQVALLLLVLIIIMGGNPVRGCRRRKSDIGLVVAAKKKKKQKKKFLKENPRVYEKVCYNLYYLLSTCALSLASLLSPPPFAWGKNRVIQVIYKSQENTMSDDDLSGLWERRGEERHTTYYYNYYSTCQHV